MLKKAIFFLILLLGMGLSRAAFSGEIITLGGTGSALGAMRQLAEVFEKSHPGVKVNVMPSLGSSGAIKAVSQGALDLAVSARSLKENEKDGLAEIKFAKTPFIFYTRREVPVPGLTTRELVEIYNGSQIKWPDGERIRLILRPRSELELQIVKSISPEMEKAVDSAESREGIVQAVTDQECADKVEGTPGALAFGGLSQIISEERSFKVLSFNGVEPNVTTLASGKYPLSISYYLITKKGPSPRAREFIKFLRSPQGASIMKKNGMVAGK